MDPALLKGQARRQPALVGTGPGTEIDDLQDAAVTTGVDQIVDQLGEEAADGGGAGRGVGGGAGGKPGRVDGDVLQAIQVGRLPPLPSAATRAGYLAGRAPPAAKSAAASVR